MASDEVNRAIYGARIEPMLAARRMGSVTATRLEAIRYESGP